MRGTPVPVRGTPVPVRGRLRERGQRPARARPEEGSEVEGVVRAEAELVQEGHLEGAVLVLQGGGADHELQLGPIQ